MKIKRTRYTFYEMRLSISQKNGGARYDAFHIRNTLEIFLRNRNAYQTHWDFIVLLCNQTLKSFFAGGSEES